MITWALTNWKLMLLGLMALMIGVLYLGLQREKALVASVTAEKAQLQATYAQAVTNATTEAMQKLQAETIRADALATKLILTQRDLDKARADLTRRIPDVAAHVPAACTFGPDFVLFWNNALGAAAAGLPEVPDPARADGAPRAPAGPGPRLQPLEPVTPQDILANLRDNGNRCQRIEAQLLKLIQLEEGRP